MQCKEKQFSIIYWKSSQRLENFQWQKWKFSFVELNIGLRLHNSTLLKEKFNKNKWTTISITKQLEERNWESEQQKNSWTYSGHLGTSREHLTINTTLEVKSSLLIYCLILHGKDLRPSWSCCNICHPCTNMGQWFKQPPSLWVHQVLNGR